MLSRLPYNKYKGINKPITAPVSLGNSVELDGRLAAKHKGGTKLSWIHERVEIHKTEVTHIARYFLEYNKRYRELRPDKTCCELCLQKFEDEEKFNLAFTSKGNKLICQRCTVIAEEHGTTVSSWPKGIETTETA